MKPVRVMPRYQCDFCKKRSTRSVMALHEKRCFRNPNRFCDNCDNTGKIAGDHIEGYGSFETDCQYCASFDREKLKEIEAYEAETNPITS